VKMFFNLFADDDDESPVATKAYFLSLSMVWLKCFISVEKFLFVQLLTSLWRFYLIKFFQVNLKSWKIFAKFKMKGLLISLAIKCILSSIINCIN
jgi:hypothetical protein